MIFSVSSDYTKLQTFIILIFLFFPNSSGFAGVQIDALNKFLGELFSNMWRDSKKIDFLFLKCGFRLLFFSVLPSGIIKLPTEAIFFLLKVLRFSLRFLFNFLVILFAYIITLVLRTFTFILHFLLWVYWNHSETVVGLSFFLLSMLCWLHWLYNVRIIIVHKTRVTTVMSYIECKNCYCLRMLHFMMLSSALVQVSWTTERLWRK